MVAESGIPIEPTGSAGPLKVMVSDVRDQYSEPLRILLEPHGFAIRRIRSGADAIRLAERRAVDAAVLDTELPDMPGVRALRVIRTLGTHMPIILVGRPAPPAEQEHLLRTALELRAFSVLAQPVDLEVLLGQMARLFDRFLSAMHRGLPGELAPGPEPTRPEPTQTPPVRRLMLRFRRRREY